MDFDGFGWICMDFDRFVWILMDLNGFGWILIDFDSPFGHANKTLVQVKPPSHPTSSYHPSGGLMEYVGYPSWGVSRLQTRFRGSVSAK